MSNLSELAALIVATTELSVVKDIRGAVRANLLHAGGVPGPLGTVLMPRPVLRERLVEPDVVYTRTAAPLAPPPPRIETIVVRNVEPIAPIPRVEASRAHPCVDHSCHDVAPRLANEAVTPVEATHRAEPEPPLGKRLTPLVPPWRLPLPEATCAAHVVVKWHAPPPDLISKGMLIDLFL